MKILPQIALLSCACLPAVAQAQSALEPCQTGAFPDYEQGVDGRIDGAIGIGPQLSLTVLPSFSPESGVRLVGSEVYHVQFESLLWAEADVTDDSGVTRKDFSSPRIKTRVHHASVSPGMARRIVEAYASAIQSARASNRMSFDGVSFRITQPGVGCGEATSPDPDTYNARLVQLLELLARHAALSRPREMQRSEEAMGALLEKLEAP